ncbi:hypothetical protein DBR06_SOUSAS1110087, partial [Sousa chinensis]
MPSFTPPFPRVVWQQQAEPAPPDRVAGDEEGEDREAGWKLKRQPAPGPPRACLSRWSLHRARRRPGLCAAVQLRGPAPPTWLHHSNCDETASSSWRRASSTVVGARAHHGRQADGRRQHLGERGAEAEPVRGKLRIMEP